MPAIINKMLLFKKYGEGDNTRWHRMEVIRQSRTMLKIKTTTLKSERVLSSGYTDVVPEEGESEIDACRRYIGYLVQDGWNEFGG